MQRLITLALIGLVAQLIDGAMGMGYGVTSSSLLLATGVAPVVASASVHMAEVATTFASGVAHWRLGNIDRRLTLTLLLPGATGAFLGALFLAAVPGDVIKPFIAGFLFLLGVSILVRFTWGRVRSGAAGRPGMRRRFVVPLGFVAGFCDASGGGGWGPIATTTILARMRTEPRKVVGSVDASEAAVAVAATAGFLLSIGWTGINTAWVIALVAGGLVAAPLAAWLVRIVPTHVLGVLVGGVIVLTNARILVQAAGAGPPLAAMTSVSIAGLLLIALAYTTIRHRTSRPAPHPDSRLVANEVGVRVNDSNARTP